MKSSFKVLVIEDEPMISDVIKVYLEHHNFSVRIEHNGKKGLDAFHTYQPDLVVLDLMLPDLTGEEICEEIRRCSRTPVIMLTAKADEEDILYGLDIGADDYITKPFSGKQLIGRVKTVLRRVHSDPLPLFTRLSYNNNALTIDIESNVVKKHVEQVKLTPSEYKILLSLVKYPNKTFSREELIFIALSQDYNGYDRIIDTHIKTLRQKIEDNYKEPKYIITVFGTRYKFGGGLSDS